MAEIFYRLDQHRLLRVRKATWKRSPSVQRRPHSLLGRWSRIFSAGARHESPGLRSPRTGRNPGGDDFTKFLSARGVPRRVAKRSSLLGTHVGSMVQRVGFREHADKTTVNFKRAFAVDAE